MLIDIHSHRLNAKPGQRQFLTVEASLLAEGRYDLPDVGENVMLSLGIHPWLALCLGNNTVSGLMPVFSDTHFSMIGEIGLDKVSSVPFEVQKTVFETQLEMAEKVKKPVLLHVVRAMAEILEAKKRHRTVPAWIIHGFRGGRQEAEQYVSKGFYLSFGAAFNPEGLLACPVDCMFLETDESGLDIEEVYGRVARTLECPVGTLEKQIEENFKKLFENSKIL